MRVYLPLATMPAEMTESRASAPTTATSKGRETILLVDDNVDLREVSREFLAASGYTVLEAGSLKEAIAVARHHSGTINLLLTDVILPSGNGREVAAELASLRPGVAILYMSGYTDDVVAQRGALDPGVAFLQKPFTRNQLLSFVRETIDAQSEVSGETISLG